jgi:hypothetical protein
MTKPFYKGGLYFKIDEKTVAEYEIVAPQRKTIAEELLRGACGDYRGRRSARGVGRGGDSVSEEERLAGLLGGTG